MDDEIAAMLNYEWCEPRLLIDEYRNIVVILERQIDAMELRALRAEEKLHVAATRFSERHTDHSIEITRLEREIKQLKEEKRG